jgi:hypothetical protein
MSKSTHLDAARIAHLDAVAEAADNESTMRLDARERSDMEGICYAVDQWRPGHFSNRSDSYVAHLYRGARRRAQSSAATDAFIAQWRSDMQAIQADAEAAQQRTDASESEFEIDAYREGYLAGLGVRSQGN